MEVAVRHFASGTLAAMTAKLASSIDDVVWLAAFLTPNLSPKERYANAITYASVCFIQTVLAFVISRGGEAALDKIIQSIFLGGSRGNQEEEGGADIVSSEKVLTLFAGFSLFVYAIKLGIEYYREEILGEGEDSDDDDDEEVGRCGKSGGYGKVQNQVIDDSAYSKKVEGNAGEENASAVEKTKTKNTADDIGTGPLLPEGAEEDDEFMKKSIDEFDNEDKLEGGKGNASGTGAKKTSPECTKPTSSNAAAEPFEIEDDDLDTSKSCLSARSRTLPIVAFLGSLDDLTLFVPMLVGKTFGIIELIIGSTVAGTIIVFICLFITKCEMLSNFLQKIPLAAIVAIFSVVLLVKGFFME